MQRAPQFSYRNVRNVIGAELRPTQGRTAVRM
jgi:hypothetical protein